MSPSLRRCLALVMALLLASPVAAAQKLKPLAADEGILAFVIDTVHGLTGVGFVASARPGSFRVADRIAPGKQPLFVRLEAGEYCLYSFSIEGRLWTMNARDGLCWTVKPGVVSYAVTLQPRQFRSALGGRFGAADNDRSNNQVIQLHDPTTFLALMAQSPAPEWTAYPQDAASLVEDVAFNARMFQRSADSLRWSRIYDGSSRLYEASFRLGRPFAAVLRGDHDRLAWGVKKDLVAAVGWYRKAAEAGDPRGAALYCQALDLGIGTAEDATAAAGWCRKAADAGDALGQYWLSRLMHRGRGGLRPDPAEEARLVEAAQRFRPFDPTREPDPRAPDADPKDHTRDVPLLMRQSFGFKAGDGSYPDAEEALRVALLESEQGEARGAMDAAYFTAKGIGCPPDWRRAEELYLRATRIGNDGDARRANNALAHAFWEGADGFPRNLARAAERFERLGVESGEWGRSQLAWFLATVDDDRLRDPKRAKELIERALRRNDGSEHAWIDTLAAALAAMGDFEGAQREQERALALALRAGATDETIADYEGRLAKYASGQAERR